jgi:hypothetical protein
MISFSDFRPDAPALSPYGRLASGVVPRGGDSYGPVASLSSQTNALDAMVKGVISAKDSDGNVYVYAGDASKLYESVSLTFSDQSKSGGYSTADGEVWEFTQFGNRIIATNYADAVQYIVIGTGSSSDFADLFTSTDKPKAKHIAAVRDFVVLGFVNDEAGVTPHRVRWGGINNSADMDESQATLAGKQDLAEGGAVQKILGGPEYGIIIQESVIRRMSFVGTPLIFDFSGIIDPSRGTHVPNSVISNGRQHYFWTEEGVFYTDGSGVYPIGDERVDRWLLNQFDPLNRHLVSSAVDVKNKLIAWAFPGEGATSTANRILFYHYTSGKFSYVDMETDMIVRAFTQGQTVDSGIITDIDIAPWASLSVDSDQFKGRRFRFAAFDTAHRLAFFTGSNVEATIDTPEVEINPGFRSKVMATWPKVDGGTPSVSVGHRNLPNEAPTFAATSAMNSIGFCSQDINARYHRFRLSIASGGSWEHAQGIEVEARRMGRY